MKSKSQVITLLLASAVATSAATTGCASAKSMDQSRPEQLTSWDVKSLKPHQRIYVVAEKNLAADCNTRTFFDYELNRYGEGRYRYEGLQADKIISTKMACTPEMPTHTKVKTKPSAIKADREGSVTITAPTGFTIKYTTGRKFGNRYKPASPIDIGPLD